MEATTSSLRGADGAGAGASDGGAAQAEAFKPDAATVDDPDRTPRPAPPLLRTPAYVVGNMHGRSSDQWGKMLEPTQERVAACVPGTGGIVRVHVENKKGRTVFTIDDPKGEFDPKTRHCILEALSTMQLDDDPSKRLGPEGFTSHIEISW